MVRSVLLSWEMGMAVTLPKIPLWPATCRKRQDKWSFCHYRFFFLKESVYPMGTYWVDTTPASFTYHNHLSALVFAMPGLEPKTMCILGNRSTSELQSSPHDNVSSLQKWERWMPQPPMAGIWSSSWIWKTWSPHFICQTDILWLRGAGTFLHGDWCGMEMRALEHKANYMSPNCLMRLKRQSGKKHSKRKVLNKKINCPKSKKKG